MEDSQDKSKILQWHPAFFAGIQIEFGEESSDLIFENEHQLGTKPKEIDALIIKKNKEKPVRKNIGHIFRKHNIIEYKSPDDYLSVDDFYKVYGYACFYKSDTNKVNGILIEDITITFICEAYPKKLMEHLTLQRGFLVEQEEPGIYRIKGDILPMQLIWTEELSFEQNTWLKSLNAKELSTNQAEYLVREYGKHKSEKLYKSVMNVIVNVSKEKFMEVKDMCEALEELMKDELEEMRERGWTEGLEAGRKAGLEAGRKAGMEEGMEAGMAAGMKVGLENGLAEGKREGKRFEALTRILMKNNRQEILLKALDDEEYRKELYIEYQIV